MKYTKTNTAVLSQFSLGTVQLGRKYGLFNDEQPSQEQAFEMLDKAIELGVNNLDTANNYGDSESVIGAWLKSRRNSGVKLPLVITKISPFDHSSPGALVGDIRRQTENCLKTLGLESLDCLMVHDYEDYARDPDLVAKAFSDLQSEGLILRSGLSAYSRHDYGVIADSPFDWIQIPQNIFDWTQITSGGLERLVRAHKTIFVRSVFLQGLVFMTPERLDPRMDFCLPYLKRFQNLCAEFKLPPASLALSFVLSLPNITAAVLGCENVAQIEANAKLIESTRVLSSSEMDRIHDAFETIDPRVINPGTWFNHF